MAAVAWRAVLRTTPAGAARVTVAANVVRQHARGGVRAFSASNDGREVVTGSTLVPKISLRPWFEGGEEGRAAVAAALDDAATNVGFFGIVDHGFPQDVMDECWGAVRGFFDLPAAEKEKLVSTDESKYPYGYVGFGGEDLAAGLAAEKGGDDGPRPDLKECISLGPYNPASGMPPPVYPQRPANFEAAWHAYYSAMEGLSGEMLRVFARALRLEESWFDDKVDRHRAALRALNYPELDAPALPGQMRASAHTDYGTLTILKPDDAPGGLQVLGKDNRWHEVPYDPHMFVINLGDLMARWTNDRWKSTLHRVVVPPSDPGRSTRRQSMAFFHNINADEVVECIDTCHSADNPIKYEPIVAFDFLMQKHLASVGKGKK